MIRLILIFWSISTFLLGVGCTHHDVITVRGSGETTIGWSREEPADITCDEAIEIIQKHANRRGWHVFVNRLDSLAITDVRVPDGRPNPEYRSAKALVYFHIAGKTHVEVFHSLALNDGDCPNAADDFVNEVTDDIQNVASERFHVRIDQHNKVTDISSR